MATERDAESIVAWAVESDEVLVRVGSGAAGLDPNEAAARLRSVGPNKLPEKPPRPAWVVLAAQLKGFLNLLLLVAAVIAWAIGDIKDALMIGAVTIFNAVLGFVQEHRAEKALSALRRMGALRARVRRAGHVLEVAADDLVPGDIVLLEPGERVPADGRLLFTHSLEVDESSLTGESEPAHKDWRAVLPLSAPLAERINLVFMSSVVTRGRGELVVCGTGRATEIGRIAELIEETKHKPTPLQEQLDALGKRIAVVALVVVAIISAVELARGDTLAQMALEAIALAVAAVPEGLPAVVTVTLALGLQRMARHRAIVKRLAAVETLGCTTTICSDKTGTLTMNQMSARAVWCGGRRFEVTGEGYGYEGEVIAESDSDAPAGFVELARAMVLCNDSRIVSGSLLGDPTEGALLALASKMGLPVEETRAAAPRIAEVPFESERKFMATLHEEDEGAVVFVKGSPGVVMRHSKLDASAREAIEAENERMASTGLRVLAVASRRFARSDLEAAPDVADLVNDLEVLGLVGLLDPPRAEARDAVALCHRAGIRVKMITGDQLATAKAIAAALGLNGVALAGKDVDDMDDETLAAVLPTVAVFARVAPEHKLRIVSALQSRGHVVAMTGDGVNDAPALRRADIGIAMGSGTEVAKEAASMILVDDNFATIVRAVREGRTIYDNIVKFVRFQLSTNAGAILTVFVAPFLGMVSPLGPVHVLWAAMISDGPPAIALGMDAARPEIMSDPPRRRDERVLTGRRIGGLLFYGSIMAAGTLASLRFASTPDAATTVAFTTFVLFQLFNVMNVRSENRSAFGRHSLTNYRLWVALAVVVLLQVAVVHWAPLQAFFRTTALSTRDWAVCVAIASTVLLADELRKLVGRLMRSPRSSGMPLRPAAPAQR